MPTKLPSPLLGYNNNVRHKGKVFHVQTEDSGVKYGHIITHLFMDGGRILKSVKTSYAEYVENDRMGEIVREMMKQQHKAMFIALRDGKFDAIIEGSGGGEAASAAPAQAFPAAPSSSTAVDAKAAPAQPAARASGLSPAGPSPAGPSPAGPSPAAARVAPAAAADAGPREEQQLSQVVEGSGPRVAEELGVDIDAVERAAAAATTGAPAMRGSVDLPPPPPNLFREKTATGKYRVTSPQAAAAAPRPPAGRPPSSSSMPSARSAGAERRYAPTRPASIFGQARPQQGKSIFGEDLISDKSLDEVILSYLAEDLEGEKK